MQSETDSKDSKFLLFEKQGNKQRIQCETKDSSCFFEKIPWNFSCQHFNKLKQLKKMKNNHFSSNFVNFCRHLKKAQKLIYISCFFQIPCKNKLAIIMIKHWKCNFCHKATSLQRMFVWLQNHQKKTHSFTW